MRLILAAPLLALIVLNGCAPRYDHEWMDAWYIETPQPELNQNY